MCDGTHKLVLYSKLALRQWPHYTKLAQRLKEVAAEVQEINAMTNYKGEHFDHQGPRGLKLLTDYKFKPLHPPELVVEPTNDPVGAAERRLWKDLPHSEPHKLN